MKKICLLLLVIILSITNLCYAKGDNYNEILSLQFTEITYYNKFDIYKATHKNGTVAIYDSEGKKISDDFDYIGDFDDFNTIAIKDGKNYVLGYHGLVSYEFDGKAINSTQSMYFVDMGNNNDDRPLSYYEGEFGVILGGKIVSTQPYSKFVMKNKYDCFNFYNGHMLYFENGKVGTVGTDFEVRISALYNDLYLAHNGWLIIAEYDGKYGFIDSGGVKIGEFEYDYIEPKYDEDNTYYVTQKDGLYGLVDKNGKVIFKPTLDVKPLSVYPDNELIVVSKRDSNTDEVLQGVIDFSGNTILETTHTNIYEIREGRIPAQKEYDKCGYYDIYGNEITEFNYRMISNYNEGMAFATKCDENNNFITEVIDYIGNVAFEANNWTNGYKNGLACIEYQKFVDKTGKVIVDLEKDGLKVSSSYWWDNQPYYSVPFSNNYVVTDGEYYGIIRIENDVEPLYEYEYIDYGNVKNLVYNPHFGYVFELYSGETKYVDFKGNEITEDEFFSQEVDDTILNPDEAYSQYGMSIINENDKYKLIDKSGKILVDNATSITHIGQGVFKIYYDYVNNALVTSDGKVLINNFNYVTNVGDNGYIGVSTYNFNGYINTDGKYMISLPHGYRPQTTFSEGLASIVTDVVYSNYGKTTYITEKGDLALKQKEESGYDWAMGNEFKNGITIIGRGVGKAGFVSSNVVKCVWGNPSDWANEDIQYAKEINLVPEQLENRYRKNISREDFCEIIYQLPFVNEKKTDNTSIAYSDTQNEKIIFLSRLGIINGIGDSKFAPDQYITREQAAVILDRVYKLFADSQFSKCDIFADDIYISDWAKDGVYSMKHQNIMNGTGDNNFSPKEMYTVEQSVITILRLYNKLK